MQIKTMITYYYALIEMVKILRLTIASFGKDMKELEVSYTADGNEMVQPLEKSLTVSHKIKHLLYAHSYVFTQEK